MPRLLPLLQIEWSHQLNKGIKPVKFKIKEKKSTRIRLDLSQQDAVDLAFLLSLVGGRHRACNIGYEIGHALEVNGFYRPEEYEDVQYSLHEDDISNGVLLS